MENSTNAAEEIGTTKLARPWITWDITFHKTLPLNEISGELPLIEDFLDKYLAKFLDYRMVAGQKFFKYKWINLKKNTSLYKLEIYVIANVPLTICKRDDIYVVFKKIFKGSDKNTVQLKPPTI